MDFSLPVVGEAPAGRSAPQSSWRTIESTAGDPLLPPECREAPSGEDCTKSMAHALSVGRRLLPHGERLSIRACDAAISALGISYRISQAPAMEADPNVFGPFVVFCLDVVVDILWIARGEQRIPPVMPGEWLICIGSVFTPLAHGTMRPDAARLWADGRSVVRR